MLFNRQEGNGASTEDEPERFYHGFVLGLMVELSDKYSITPNRESGFGRCDVLLKPKDKKDDVIIIEFRVHKPKKETSLEETVQAALLQMQEKNMMKSCLQKYMAQGRYAITVLLSVGKRYCC